MNRALPLVLLALVSAAGCRKNIPHPDVKPAGDVARGQYLAAHVMVCIACHSQRDWTYLGGPYQEGTAFAGSGDIARTDGFPASFSFGAANLTPHGLSTWSDGEVARASFLGQSKDGRGLFPLMPYREYREHVALDDAGAVVAFLRSLPAVAHDVPPPKFPIPGFVMDGFPEPRELPAAAPKPGDPGYGKYVAGVGACVACHTNIDNRGKALGPAWAGGREFPVPAPGAGKVRSSNLTPDDETGIGKWTKEMFVARFKAATLEAARAQPVEKGGYNTVMPWWAYAGMTEEDLGAVFDYLKTLPPVKQPVVKYDAP